MYSADSKDTLLAIAPMQIWCLVMLTVCEGWVGVVIWGFQFVVLCVGASILAIKMGEES